MKICEVLMGPILGNEGKLHHEGEEIVLDAAMAELLERLRYVKIVGDAPDGSELSARGGGGDTDTSPSPDEEEPTHGPSEEGNKRKRKVMVEVGE